MDKEFLKAIGGNSPIAGVLLLFSWALLRLLKSHLKQMKGLAEENLKAREITREKLDRNSEVLGENTAVMRDVTAALRDLNRHLGRKPLQGDR